MEMVVSELKVWVVTLSSTLLLAIQVLSMIADLTFTSLLCGKHVKLIYTVEPPKRGHFGTAAFVLSLEVVLFSEVV